MTQLRNAFQSKGVVKRPKGRLKKRIEETIVRPSKIPRYKRLRIVPIELIKNSRLEKLRHLLEDYKNLLFNRYKHNPRFAKRRFIQNARDLTQFYQRYPLHLEQELPLPTVLPSYIFDKLIPIRIDLEVFLREINSRTKHDQLFASISEELYQRFKKEIDDKDIETIRYFVEGVAKKLIDQVKVQIRKIDLSLKFFCRFQAICICR